MFRSAFPDLELTPEDVIADGDTVVRRDRITGTHDGEFMGIPPTGKQSQLPHPTSLSLSTSLVEGGACP